MNARSQSELSTTLLILQLTRARHQARYSTRHAHWNTANHSTAVYVLQRREHSERHVMEEAATPQTATSHRCMACQHAGCMRVGTQTPAHRVQRRSSTLHSSVGPAHI